MVKLAFVLKGLFNNRTRMFQALKIILSLFSLCFENLLSDQSNIPHCNNLRFYFLFLWLLDTRIVKGNWVVSTRQ